MSDLAVSVGEIGESDARFGGKARALGMMVKRGLKVPEALGISTLAYDRYVDSTGLRGRILLELNRKGFEDMRWEEMWDASLRIRSTFAATPFPSDLRSDLEDVLRRFENRSVVVRSSALGEDTAKSSFAGIHESYVNVSGIESILDHVKLVWASLWSDAAMLYRKELGLDVETSAMAVMVQEMLTGDRSGVAFGVNPNRDDQSVIEAVHGLNQGLVDGTVEPDRWILDRETGKVLAHHPARRDRAVVPTPDGVELAALPPERAEVPPISDDEAFRVYRLVMEAEAVFGSPQDVEWTFRGEDLCVLQSRPITTLIGQDSDEKRTWYLSLKRSFENLQDLKRRIEEVLIPAMREEARLLDGVDLASFPDEKLAEEIERRAEVRDRWRQVYWDEFIPFAHGMRLFGQVYNDVVCPSDPYEFVDLLAGTNMMSLERNRRLEEMASRVRTDPDLERMLKEGEIPSDFEREVDSFMSRFGGRYSQTRGAKAGIVGLLLELSTHPAQRRRKVSKSSLKEGFLSRFQGEDGRWAEDLLELARVSYRLRDDDNIYLGEIEARLTAAAEVGRRRLERRGLHLAGQIPWDEVVFALKDPDHLPRAAPARDGQEEASQVRARQLVGQPAGPGIATGRARVIREEPDLFGFKRGEILVVDAVDPNMTFVVPLAAGIVERRGGMLIHGSIIAREYGIPCVTGVSDAANQIKTRDLVTVDGFLGLVTIAWKMSGRQKSFKTFKTK